MGGEGVGGVGSFPFPFSFSFFLLLFFFGVGLDGLISKSGLSETNSFSGEEGGVGGGRGGGEREGRSQGQGLLSVMLICHADNFVTLHPYQQQINYQQKNGLLVITLLAANKLSAAMLLMC